MEKRIIRGMKKVEGLNLKLESVSKNLREAIISDSRRQKELLQEYKKIQQKIKVEEEKVEKLKKEEQQRKAKEDKELKEEEEKIKDDILGDKNEGLSKIAKKQEKIDKKLKTLEYDREDCLQTLNIVNLELSKVEQEFDDIKQTGNIEDIVELDKKLKDMKQRRSEMDKKLDKTNARLSMAMLMKMILNDKNIERTRNIVETYNKDAEEFGLEKINIEELIKEKATSTQLKNIRKGQQTKYYKDKYAETVADNLNSENIEYNNLKEIKQLDDDKRKQIELESNKRVKDKKSNSLPTRIIKSTGKGIAKATKTIAGVAILTAKFIGKSAKRLWQKMKQGTNIGLKDANQLMLNSTTKIREKSEEDAKTFETRREKLMENIKSDVDEGKAQKTSEEKEEKENEKSGRDL